MVKKKIGSKFWACSYVVLKNGTKIYLEEIFEELEEQMNSNSKTVTLEISNKYELIVIKKKNIEFYGEVF